MRQSWKAEGGSSRREGKRGKVRKSNDVFFPLGYEGCLPCCYSAASTWECCDWQWQEGPILPSPVIFPPSCRENGVALVPEAEAEPSAPQLTNHRPSLRFPNRWWADLTMTGRSD